MKAVFLESGSFHPECLDRLKVFFNDWTDYKAGTSDDVVEYAKDAEVIFVNKIKITEEIMDQLPKLRFICITARGMNNVDLDAARERNILVENSGTYSTHSVAEHTLSLILALSRRLVENRIALESGAWQKSPRFCLVDHPPMDLEGKKLGIIGYGSIGKRVAKLAECFGMKVLIAQYKTQTRGRIPIKELLPEVDILSLHCSLNDDNIGLIGERELRMMPKHSILINVTRGELIDEKALAKALVEEEIFGAGIDVIQNEPPLNDDVLVNLNHPRLILTPHMAWATRRAQNQLIDNVSEKLKAFLKN